MTYVIQNNADVLCEVCGCNTRIPGYGLQFGTLQAAWGYGSKHDGERYRVNLCEICFFQALTNLRQERRISRLFDDKQPADDLTFGRVASDEFWGES